MALFKKIRHRQKLALSRVYPEFIEGKGHRHSHSLGFTLIETVIYLTILGSILVLIVGFFWNIVLANIKENSYQEVQQNARFALTKITQETKKATALDFPLPGASANWLSLEMADSNLNPTIFDVIEGKLRITQGTNPSYFLTTDRVIVNNLQFTNLSYDNTPGTIRIVMEITHSNPSARVEYQAWLDLKLTISLLKGGAAP